MTNFVVEVTFLSSEWDVSSSGVYLAAYEVAKTDLPLQCNG